MKLPKTGTDARKIRESFELSQEDFAETFGWMKEHVQRTERRERLTIVEQWFFWYLKTFGLPEGKK